MSLPPVSIEVGKCYLTGSGRVWRIVQIMPDGRIVYEWRSPRAGAKKWYAGMINAVAAGALIQREVPCEWTPETGEV